MSIRVAIVDDHAILRAGFREMLANLPEIEVVAEGDCGEEALNIVRELQPDVLILDISMPGISGVEVTQRLHRGKSSTRVVIVTMHGDGPLPRMLLDAGASGFLTKNCTKEVLIDAVISVHNGRRFIEHGIAQRMALVARGERSTLDRLTAREFEVALMLGRGLRSIDIAGRLHISEKTVHTYKSRIYAKLEINSEAALTLLLVRHGLLTEF
jgi:two-component system, NarL family, invasion response regulator UvrY